MATAAGGTRPTGMHSCIELGVGVHTARRHTSSQIPIGHCSDCIGLDLGICVSVR